MFAIGRTSEEVICLDPDWSRDYLFLYLLEKNSVSWPLTGARKWTAFRSGTPTPTAE